MKNTKIAHSIMVVVFSVCMLFMLLTTCSVKADVIEEPRDDFYNSHRDECEYTRRDYKANGPDGSVIFYASPENPREVDSVKNGEIVYVSWLYKDSDNRTWGFDESRGGWASMTYLPVVYDSISFMEQYADQIENVEMTIETNLSGKVLFWKYPGAEEPFATIEEDVFVCDFQDYYTDSLCRKWGHLNYWCGYRDFWVCIDAPASETASSESGVTILEEGAEVNLDGDCPQVPMGAEETSNAFYVIGGCVILAIAATIVIVLRYTKKRKMEE